VQFKLVLTGKTYGEAVNNIGGNKEHMAVEKETIIEKRVIWNFRESTNPCVATFREAFTR
jgi:hypothetical protein